MLVGKGHIKITPTKSVQNPTTFNEILKPLLTTDDLTITIAHLDTMAQVSLNPSFGSIFLYLFVPGLFTLCENPENSVVGYGVGGWEMFSVTSFLNHQRMILGPGISLGRKDSPQEAIGTEGPYQFF